LFILFMNLAESFFSRSGVVLAGHPSPSRSSGSCTNSGTAG
jgi:hypothetical protein